MAETAPRRRLARPGVHGGNRRVRGRRPVRPHGHDLRRRLRTRGAFRPARRRDRAHPGHDGAHRLRRLPDRLAARGPHHRRPSRPLVPAAAGAPAPGGHQPARGGRHGRRVLAGVDRRRLPVGLRRRHGVPVDPPRSGQLLHIGDERRRGGGAAGQRRPGTCPDPALRRPPGRATPSDPKAQPMDVALVGFAVLLVLVFPARADRLRDGPGRVRRLRADVGMAAVARHGRHHRLRHRAELRALGRAHVHPYGQFRGPPPTCRPSSTTPRTPFSATAAAGSRWRPSSPAAASARSAARRSRPQPPCRRWRCRRCAATGMPTRWRPPRSPPAARSASSSRRASSSSSTV